MARQMQWRRIGTKWGLFDLNGDGSQPRAWRDDMNEILMLSRKSRFFNGATPHARTSMRYW